MYRVEWKIKHENFIQNVDNDDFTEDIEFIEGLLKHLNSKEDTFDIKIVEKVDVTYKFVTGIFKEKEIIEKVKRYGIFCNNEKHYSSLRMTEEEAATEVEKLNARHSFAFADEIDDYHYKEVWV